MVLDKRGFRAYCVDVNCGLNFLSINTNVQFGAVNGRNKVDNNVMIASNVVIKAANHGMKLGMPMKLQPSEPGVIVVDDDSWIGSNAVIATDFTLARGTVVGAGAVVTHSTSEFSIVAGVSAPKKGERVLRSFSGTLMGGALKTQVQHFVGENVAWEKVTNN